MSEADHWILKDLGYYMHAGSQGVLLKDYSIYLKFMKKHFVEKQASFLFVR